MSKFNNNITRGILFTDQYQLVMAQLYFKNGIHEREVQFDHFFRNYPDYGSHKAGYCVNAGLEWFVDWMKDARFGKDEIELLRNHKNSKGEKIYQDDFLEWLKKNGNYDGITLKSIPEGRIVHPHEPLNIVQGPMAMAQIIETAMLNKLNYQTLIATKASRIKEIGRKNLLLEFGTRRGQDEGANAGVRAALIGGADFSSNVGISYVLGYNPQGTHAHSMVQMFLALGMSELDSFEAFAELYPDNCILLVDTINTLESGIPNAIKVFQKLKQKGHKPVGIRLDSGDLAFLSIEAAKLLNAAGFEEVGIVLSNELDEMNIWQIITQITIEAPKEGLDPDKIIGRLIYGVGTRLVTSVGDPALGGVCKLVAVKQDNDWASAIKLSESPEKIPAPGNKQVWRIYGKNKNATADLIGFEGEKPEQEEQLILRHPFQPGKSRKILKEDCARIDPLLEEVVKEGVIKYDFPSIDEIRKVREEDLDRLNSGVKRLINPHHYHVSLTQKMFNKKQELINKIKN